MLSDRATRLTAKVAPYRESIAAARKAGLTWADIARILQMQVAPAALRQAVKRSCRYQAAQAPLPEHERTPQAAQPSARPSTTPQPAPQAAPASGQESSIKRLKL
jgi:hypothetical protein